MYSAKALNTILSRRNVRRRIELKYAVSNMSIIKGQASMREAHYLQRVKVKSTAKKCRAEVA
jgi:hypothetical protein